MMENFPDRISPMTLAAAMALGSGGGDTPSAKVYYPAGSVPFLGLPALSEDRIGAVYDVTDEFTSTEDFTDGGGKDYPAGTNVGIVNVGTEASPVLKYDCMMGDLSEILSVIPQTASSSNPLATQADVRNEEITVTATASPISTANGKPRAITIYGKSEVVDGAIKSAGEGWSTVDLGTLGWSRSTSYTNPFFYASISAAKTNGSGLIAQFKKITNATAGNFGTNAQDNQYCFTSGTATAQLLIRCDTYTDATAFKNAMSGVLLCYELADPTQGNTIAVKTDNGTGIDGTMATFSTGTPLRSTADGTVRDEAQCNGITGEVITRCEIVEGQVVPLATPIVTTMTAQEIANFNDLRTFTLTTHITNNAGADMTVEAYAGTANGKAVNELKQDVQKQIDDIKLEKSHFCYSYKIDMNNSDPFTNCKPHFDTRYGCDNFNFTSAHMDYANDRFDYGSWEGFIRRIARPCMLKYDGTVDYYLDPDDYSKKITGEASDVADVNYQGNAMVELEKLYFKRYTYNGIQYCFIADRKLDKSFKAYAHHDKYGKELDYIYRACYDGMYDGTRLRSISGIDYHNLNTLTAGYIMSNTTRQEEMNFAKANNVSTEQGEGWNILHKSEWDYINDILVLISMSTDTQGTFGHGRDSGYVSTLDTGIISTGTMDDKGLFWGKNDSTAGVKVLGIENHWANIWKSCAGWMLISNQHYTKMTFGTEDGSTGTGFNTDSTGYLATGASISANGYISDWAENDNGFLPTAASGSASMYRCDYVWQNTIACFALVGGSSNYGLQCGAFCENLYYGTGIHNWNVGAALSYKPLSAA